MKARICLFLIILTVSPLLSQETVNTIKLELREIANVQGCVTGDTILFSYYEPGYPNRCWLLTENGKKINPLPFLLRNNLVGIKSSVDSLYFVNLIENNSMPYLRVSAYSSVSEKLNITSKTFSLPGRIIGISGKSNFRIVSLHEKESILYLTTINDLGRMDVAKFSITREIAKMVKSAAFMDDQDNLTPEQAEADSKIYLLEKEIVICTDVSFKGTQLTRINLASGECSSIMIEKESHKPFSSAYHEGLIYRVVRDRGVSLSVYDVDKKVYSYRIDKSTEFIKESAFVRFDYHGHVLNNRSVWDAFDNIGDMFVSVHRTDSDSLVLKIGTHKSATTGSPVIGAGVPALLISSLVVHALTNRVIEGKGTSYYFYLTGNLQNGFDYSGSPDFYQYRIDMNELDDPRNPIDHNFKGYIRGEDSVYGIYQRKSEKELKIVRYLH